MAPVAQSSDRSGMMWLFHAAELPQSWVYQMAHGEVLITKEPEQQSNAPNTPTLLASQHTMQSLKRPATFAAEDPWVKSDPWLKPAPTREVSVGQMQALETNLEKKLLEKLRGEDSDMPQATDSRVVALEQQVESLSASVSAFQLAQTNQN